MLRTPILCIMAAMLSGASDAIAQSDPVDLDCEVNGYDVIVRNVSDGVFPVGLAIDWTVPFSRSAGVHELQEPFEPGGRIYLSAVLGSNYLEPGTPCTVAFAEPRAEPDGGAGETANEQ